MMIEREIKNWSEFEDAINEFIPGPSLSNKFAFRGQAKYVWSLEPSLLRAATADFPKLGLKKVEHRATAYFASRAAIYHPNASTWGPDDWESWWPLMQHYGAPTRLLDWTKSPYVAAYFAVESLETEDGALYYVHYEQVNEATAENMGSRLRDQRFIEESWNDIIKSPPYIKFILPSRMTERMSAQQGMYSICKSPLTDHVDAIQYALRNEPQAYFGKIKIPHELKLEFAQRLQYMNISAGTLFPGTDGLGKEVKSFIAHQVYTDSSLERVLRSDPVRRDEFMRAFNKFINDWDDNMDQIQTINQSLLSLGNFAPNIGDEQTTEEE